MTNPRDMLEVRPESRVFVLVAILVLTGAIALAQENRAPDTGLALNSDAAFDGYTLLAPIASTSTYLIDNEGRCVHHWQSLYTPGHAAYLLENGNLLRAGNLGGQARGAFHGGGAGGVIEEFAWDGSLEWSFQYASTRVRQHHDMERMPNGNILIIAWERKSDDEAIEAGRKPELLGKEGLWPDHIVEAAPEGHTGGRIVWEWHVWDHLIQDYDRDKDNYGVVADHPERINLNPDDWTKAISEEEWAQLEALGYLGGPVANPSGRTRPSGGRPGGNADWNHTNAIAYNAKLDQIALSVLGYNEIWIIDHSTTTREAAGNSGGRYGKGGGLLYRWGNPRVYGAGGPQDQQLFAQHDVHWIPQGSPGEGHLLVFNNGRGRQDGPYSSVDEIVPPIQADGSYALEEDEAYGPKAPLWSYTAPHKPDFHSGHISGAQRMPNGNTLICEGVTGTVFEVTQDKQVVWRYITPGGRNTGRPPGPPRRPEGPPPRPSEVDTDGNGQVSFTEASQLPFMDRVLFEDLDRDRNGYLSRNELPPDPEHLQFGPPMPSQLDENGDGKVSFWEAGALPFMDRQHFDYLDRNGDQYLDKSELPPDPPPGMGPPGFAPPRPPRHPEDRGRPGGMRRPEGQRPPRQGPGPGRPPGPRGPHGPGRTGPRNDLFRAYRYAPSFPGLIGRSLVPGKSLEEMLAEQKQSRHTAPR